MGDTSKAQIRYGTDFSGGSGLQGGRTIYAKPFVKAPKTIIGGYIDFSLTRCSGGSRDCRSRLEFDQERFRAVLLFPGYGPAQRGRRTRG